LKLHLLGQNSIELRTKSKCFEENGKICWKFSKYIKLQ